MKKIHDSSIIEGFVTSLAAREKKGKKGGREEKKGTLTVL